MSTQLSHNAYRELFEHLGRGGDVIWLAVRRAGPAGLSARAIKKLWGVSADEMECVLGNEGYRVTIEGEGRGQRVVADVESFNRQQVRAKQIRVADEHKKAMRALLASLPNDAQGLWTAVHKSGPTGLSVVAIRRKWGHFSDEIPGVLEDLGHKVEIVGKSGGRKVVAVE